MITTTGNNALWVLHPRKEKEQYNGPDASTDFNCAALLHKLCQIVKILIGLWFSSLCLSFPELSLLSIAASTVQRNLIHCYSVQTLLAR